MKYRLTYLGKNGPYHYTLYIEECMSIWRRLFTYYRPRSYVVHGNRGFWEHRVTGIPVPQEVRDFADEVVSEYDKRICLRK